MKNMTPLDPLEAGLPHREPFLFLDEITARMADEAECRKTFAGTEDFFRGHFPGEPIVPGVLLTEALAQTAGVAAAERPGQRFFLSAIRNMKFLRAVLPGETLVLKAKVAARFGALVQCEVEAFVEETSIAKGQIVLAEPPEGAQNAGRHG